VTTFLFASPYAGLAMLILLALLVVHLARGRARRASLVFPVTSPFRAIPPGLAVRLRHLPVTLRVLGLLLLVAAFAHGFLQSRIAVIRKELERIGLVIFLAHEEQRRFTSKQQQRSGKHSGAARDERSQPLAIGAIAHLVMVGDAKDKILRWKIVCRGSTRASIKGTVLARVQPASLQDPCNFFHAATKHAEEILLFPGLADPHGVVKIIRPDGVEIPAFLLRRIENVAGIAVILRDNKSAVLMNNGSGFG